MASVGLPLAHRRRSSRAEVLLRPRGDVFPSVAGEGGPRWPSEGSRSERVREWGERERERECRRGGWACDVKRQNQIITIKTAHPRDQESKSSIQGPKGNAGLLTHRPREDSASFQVLPLNRSCGSTSSRSSASPAPSSKPPSPMPPRRSQGSGRSAVQ